jgi:hypothetical protein
MKLFWEEKINPQELVKMGEREMERTFRNRYTYSAHEAVGVELTVERWNVVFHDGTIASCAFRRKHVEVVVAAVRFAVTFMEAIIAELLAALGAEEVLGVPGLVQSCHAFLTEEKENRLEQSDCGWLNVSGIYIQNGAVAVGASWTEEIVIVGFAVWISIAFEEVPRA